MADDRNKSGGFFGNFGVNEAVALGGGLVNAITGRSAAKASKEMMRRQAQTIQLQNKNFLAAQPYFQQLMQAYAGRAGIGLAPGLTQTGANTFRATTPGRLGSNYGSPEDQLRMSAAEEDVNRYFQQQANQLRHRLGQGAGAEAALARLGSQQAQQLAGFRRQLAIEAPREEERRMANLMQLIGMGFGQGTQAAAGFGQQGAQYGQQAAAANQGLGNIVQQYMYQNTLANQLGQGGGGGDNTALMLQLQQLMRQQQPVGTADTYVDPRLAFGQRF